MFEVSQFHTAFQQQESLKRVTWLQRLTLDSTEERPLRQELLPASTYLTGLQKVLSPILRLSENITRLQRTNNIAVYHFLKEGWRLEVIPFVKGVFATCLHYARPEQAQKK